MRVLARVITLGSLGLFIGAAPSAFAQDPNAYPPQQYPQQPVPQQQYPQQPVPQQQYPQQPVPQQQYPQQPVPQQQYPQQQYPQQQTYPPPGYAAPTPAASPSYQPAYAPLPPPAYTDLRHGGLAILTLGLNLPMGKGADSYSTGASLGTLLGGHITHDISLNGEFSIHILNATNASSTESEAFVDFAFSPLFHFGQGNMEFAIGPKIGAFGYAMSYDGVDNKVSASGYAYGFNAAVFFQLTPSMAIGGLLNYTGRHATEVCSTLNGSESCRKPTTNDDMDMITFNGALRW